jgi:hypothetical protein
LCRLKSGYYKKVTYPSANIEIMGKMLGTADLLGQMADRLYLEKLIPLFHEFEEGKVPGFESELNLLRKPTNFYISAQAGLKTISAMLIAIWSATFRIIGISKEISIMNLLKRI